MTETLQITPRLPANTSPFQKGKDEYYTIEIKRMISTPVGEGVIIAMLKLNDVGSGLTQEQVNGYELMINEIGGDNNTISIPQNGLTFLMTSVSTLVSESQMVITLAPAEAANIYTLHLDVLSAAQLIIPRSNELFIEHRPGKPYYITVDFAPKRSEQGEATPATTEPTGEPLAQAASAPAPQATPTPVQSSTDVQTPTQQLDEPVVPTAEAPESATVAEPPQVEPQAELAAAPVPEVTFQTDPVVTAVAEPTDNALAAQPQTEPQDFQPQLPETAQTSVESIPTVADDSGVEPTKEVADQARDEQLEPGTDPVDDEAANAANIDPAEQIPQYQTLNADGETPVLNN